MIHSLITWNPRLNSSTALSSSSSQPDSTVSDHNAWQLHPACRSAESWLQTISGLVLRCCKCSTHLSASTTFGHMAIMAPPPSALLAHQSQTLTGICCSLQGGLLSLLVEGGVSSCREGFS